MKQAEKRFFVSDGCSQMEVFWGFLFYLFFPAIYTLYRNQGEINEEHINAG